MNIDMVIALVCTAVSAMALAFLFVKGMLGTADGLKRAGSTPSSTARSCILRG